MRFIGDVHGKFDEYLALIEGVEASIQCGDMGIGFGIPFPIVPNEHKFIRGNHDDFKACLKIPNFIHDADMFDGMFFLGGAWSIDWEYRQRYEESTGRKIWWKEEELSYPQLDKAIEWYEIAKPEIMVSHDCPLIMAQEVHSQHEWDKRRTRKALNSMLESQKPDVWSVVHHHINMTKDIQGTRFMCLAELQHMDI